MPTLSSGRQYGISFGVYHDWAHSRLPTWFLWSDYNTLTRFLWIYLAQTILLVLTFTLLIFKRRHFTFRQNTISGALLGTPIQWLIVSMHVYRFATCWPLPPWLLILRNYFLFPLFMVMALQVRGMDLLFDYFWTFSMDQRRTEPSLPENPLWRRLAVSVRQPYIHAWLKSHGVHLMILVLAVVHSGAAFILLISNYQEEIPYWQNGSMQLEDIGVAVSIIFYVIIWAPIMLYYLNYVKDAYGLRQELKLGVCWAWPFYLMYASFRHFKFLQPIRSEFSSYLLLLLVMTSLHITSVVIPLIKTTLQNNAGPIPVLISEEEVALERRSPYDAIVRLYLDDSHDVKSSVTIIIPHRPITLERILRHPYLANQFEAYCKRAFVWDAVLFFHTVNDFRACTLKDDGQLEPQATKIYEEYIKAGSPCEMNLLHSTTQGILRCYNSKQFSPDMYDDAQSEVLRLIGNCTYRNFMYSLDPLVKLSYLVPHAYPTVSPITPPDLPLSDSVHRVPP